MQGMDLLTLTFLGWIYQSTADSTFCVSVNASTNFIKLGESFSIDYNIFGLSGLDNANIRVEILLRQNNYIKRPVKVRISEIKGEQDNYRWKITFIYTKDDLQNRTLLRLDVSNASASNEGLYLLYATLNNVTKYNSIHLHTNSSRAPNLSNFVIMPKTNASVTLIPNDCSKYGFSIFEDESFVHQISLNESTFFPVLPTFNINNKSIVISKPWISYKGCYNYTVDTSKEEDCSAIDVTEWTNTISRLPLIGVTRLNRCILLDESENTTAKQVSYDYCREDRDDSFEYIELYSIIDSSPSFTGGKSSACNAAYIEIVANKTVLRGIPCLKSDRCEAFCLRHDGSNVSYHNYIKWKVAMDVCTSQNKSLPGIDSGFLTSPVDRDNKSLICLAVHQNSSIMFRPVIKQVVANTDGNTTFEPINNTRGLPFLCRVKTDSKKPVPCINSSQTGTNVLTATIATPTSQRNTKLIIIIAPSAVGFLLMVVVVSFVIHRVKRNRRNQRIRNTGIMNKEYIYSQPDNTQEAATENIQREPDNNIDQLEEEYSKLHSADKMEFNKTLDDDYAMTEESSEYDVLGSKRKNQEVSVDANIYDRANNSVSGIYDTTLQTPDNNTYNL